MQPAIRLNLLHIYLFNRRSGFCGFIGNRTFALALFFNSLTIRFKRHNIYGNYPDNYPSTFDIFVILLISDIRKDSLFCLLR